MSEQQKIENSSQLNPNLIAAILLTSFIVIGGLILANIGLSAAQNGEEDSVVVAVVAPTGTPLPTNTPLPPTATITPTLIPTDEPTPTATATDLPPASSTPQVVADTGQAANTASAAEYDPALVAQGETLFLLCSACHGADGRGLPNLGKDLVDSEFVHSLSDADLLTFIKTGRPIWDPLNTTGIDMPGKGGNPALTDDDILAIIAYMRTIAAPASGQTEAPPVSDDSATTTYDPALVAQGETLFLLCSACHGADGRGLPNLGKDLVDSEFVHSQNDADLLTFIKTGRPIWDPLNTTGIDMPGKGGNPALTDDDILAIIAYIRSLSATGG